MEERGGPSQPKPEGFFTRVKNKILGRTSDQATQTPVDLQGHSTTVVKHDDGNQTVITATTDRDGGKSHTFMNVDPKIDATSLGKPLATPKNEKAIGIQGGAVVSVVDGKVKLTSPQKIAVGKL